MFNLCRHLRTACISIIQNIIFSGSLSTIECHTLVFILTPVIIWQRVVKIVLPNMEINAYFAWLLFQSLMVLSTFCIQKYTYDPLESFSWGASMHSQCKVTEATCKQACFGSPSCGMMSYNMVNGTCLLPSQPWAVARKREVYRLMMFRREENVECTVWVRDQAGENCWWWWHSRWQWAPTWNGLVYIYCPRGTANLLSKPRCPNGSC